MASKKIELVEVTVEGQVFQAKECTGCEELKLLEEYHASKSGLGGKRSICKACIKKYQKQNKDKMYEATQRYYEKNKEEISLKSRIRNKKKMELANPNYVPRNNWPKELIIETIQQRYKSGEKLNNTYMNINHGGLYGTAIYIFGSWKKAITEAGINYDDVKDDTRNAIRIGLEFEAILEEILFAIDLDIERNKKIGSFIPDFTLNSFQGHYIDAKLRFDSYSTSGTIKKYKDEADVLTIIYLEGSKKKASGNVRVISVYEYMDRYLEDEALKEEFTARLKELESRL
ncbi:hypothetical protein [Fictibacillus fluitans]|uniref:Uncharacterized protein n=1 Tax=Fictibacillus fluitans TaxID=3058422 RepID=A0ABT8HQY4_9BACL|nr:hypothetical protein [Fictibacillus sp. NE201]MDN4523185.1 hypothetical protein [Fictibacillus sp. NE201]